MLKWWRVPLYPDWINAENTIIQLVTFQIQILNSNFQRQNKLLYLPVFVTKHIFKTHQHCCFLCFHSRWRLFLFHKDKEITKSLFTIAENNFSERKLSCTCLNFGKILFAGTKRAVPGGQYRSFLPGSQSEHRICRILPARGACHIINSSPHAQSTYLALPPYSRGLKLPCGSSSRILRCDHSTF